MTKPIEPGILKVFRWYVGIRFGLGLLQVWVVNQEADLANPRFPRAGVFFFGLLAIVLFWPAAQRKLGRWFLPLALVLATLGPIAESAANVAGRLDAGLGPNEALADYWQPFFLLWVPLLMTAWQYRFRAVLVFAIGSTFLDLALTVPPLEQANADITIVGALIFARGLLFAFVGLFVVKLMGGQKEARQALTVHASTLEELATSRERNRLARELHDTLAHSLSAVAVQLEAVKALWDEDPARAKMMLDQSLEGARGGLGEARRAIQALRASPLEELGLAAALDHLGSAVESRSALRVGVHVDDTVGELRSEVEQAVYRITDEALTNVVRHGEAAEAHVALRRKGRRVILEVRDDGKGFDTKQPVPNGHVGLQGMRERAAMVGGVLAVDSSQGSGTTVQFEVEAPR
jgi:signal transduction histidine kinase